MAIRSAISSSPRQQSISLDVLELNCRQSRVVRTPGMRRLECLC